jgi:hypothetical protein
MQHFPAFCVIKVMNTRIVLILTFFLAFHLCGAQSKLFEYVKMDTLGVPGAADFGCEWQMLTGRQIGLAGYKKVRSDTLYECFVYIKHLNEAYKGTFEFTHAYIYKGKKRSKVYKLPEKWWREGSILRISAPAIGTLKVKKAETGSK